MRALTVVQQFYDFGQRFYDPRTSLFLGIDPVTKTSGVTSGSIVYARNNPMRFGDPSGRAPWDLIEGEHHWEPLPPEHDEAQYSTIFDYPSRLPDLDTVIAVAAVVLPEFRVAQDVVRAYGTLLEVEEVETAVAEGRAARAAFGEVTGALSGAEGTGTAAASSFTADPGFTEVPANSFTHKVLADEAKREAAAAVKAANFETALYREALGKRDTLAAEEALKKHPRATVVGAWSESEGQSVAATSLGGGKGCAEGVCKQMLNNASDVKFTRAVRPSKLADPAKKFVKVCENCESTYGRGAFPDPDTKYKSDDSEK